MTIADVVRFQMSPLTKFLDTEGVHEREAKISTEKNVQNFDNIIIMYVILWRIEKTQICEKIRFTICEGKGKAQTWLMNRFDDDGSSYSGLNGTKEKNQKSR